MDSKFAGFCPVHGALLSAQMKFDERTKDYLCALPDEIRHGIEHACLNSCTGPGADAALAAMGERDEAFERGRAEGRKDIGKYSYAIGSIEAVLGIVGSVPMKQTITAVESLAKERDELRAALEWAMGWTIFVGNASGMYPEDNRADAPNYSAARKLIGWDK